MKKNNSNLPRSVKENSIRGIILAKGSQNVSYIRGRPHIMSATRGGGPKLFYDFFLTRSRVRQLEGSGEI